MMKSAVGMKTAVCTDYEDLLEECQNAWKSWNHRRSEIYSSEKRGLQSDNELRVLQAKYARAYAHLRNHLNDCNTCTWVSNIDRQSDFKTGARMYA